jgi:integrase
MNAALKVVSVPELESAETEFDKDSWDVRNIPGAQYTASMSDHKLNFTDIPDVFRAVVKQYIRFWLAQHAMSSCKTKIYGLRTFFVFYHQVYPERQDLNTLSRTDIEKYLVNLRGLTMGNGQPMSADKFWVTIASLSSFLDYLQRTSHPCRPTINVGQLVWREDRGKKPQHNTRIFKHIPESVLQQLEQHIEKLPAHILPVIILLRASGFRISDVLNLRHNTCLERTSSGWWLCGDIPKTQVMNHKIPISDEIASIVAAQRALVQEKFTDADNPQRYLFPALTRKRKGRPMYSQPFYIALNKLGFDNPVWPISIFNFGPLRYARLAHLRSKSRRLGTPPFRAIFPRNLWGKTAILP